MVKFKIILIIVSLMLFSTCKSADFKKERNEVNLEVLNLIKLINKHNETRLRLTYQIMRHASYIELIDVETFKTMNQNREETIELNNIFFDNKLSKRRISDYFQKQNEQFSELPDLIEKIFNSDGIENYSPFFDLMSTFQSNENRLKKVTEDYNELIEKKSEYINYPKGKILTYQN